MLTRREVLDDIVAALENCPVPVADYDIEGIAASAYMYSAVHSGYIVMTEAAEFWEVVADNFVG